MTWDDWLAGKGDNDEQEEGMDIIDVLAKGALATALSSVFTVAVNDSNNSGSDTAPKLALMALMQTQKADPSLMGPLLSMVCFVCGHLLSDLESDGDQDSMRHRLTAAVERAHLEIERVARELLSDVTTRSGTLNASGPVIKA